jgi:hypothetical protein
MDSRHKLDAPNNETLKNIEQLDDRSEIAAVYTRGKDQWDGELVSEDEREARRQHKLDTMSFGIRKEFVLIGFLFPLPFILAAVISVAALTFIDEGNVALFVVPAIILFFMWATITYFSYRKLYTAFYMNAVQTAPYAFVLLSMLGFVTFTAYHIITLFYDIPALGMAGILSTLAILASIVCNFFLLRLWTTPVIPSGIKLLIIILVGAGITFSLF